MARNIEEIQLEMDAAKAAESALSGVTSTSTVAIWKGIRNMVAAAIYSFEKILDRHKADVELLAARSEYGSAPWYAQKVLEWQYGDTLTIVNGLPAYAVIDEAKRLVKRVSVNDGATGGLVVKVAKEVSGELVALTTAELNAFKYYLNKVKFAGIYTTAISLTADLLKGAITIYHDGLRDLTELEADLDAAAVAFVAAIDFDGVFNTIKFIDALQQVDGVVDVVVSNVYNKASGDIYRLVDRRINPTSGYFKIDETVGGFVWTLVIQ